MTVPSIIPFRCHQCGRQFDPDGGGICSKCNRLLCSRHLHGFLGSLVPNPWTGRELVCVACRQATRAGEHGARD
jgi:hypothetical protein